MAGASIAQTGFALVSESDEVCQQLGGPRQGRIDLCNRGAIAATVLDRKHHIGCFFPEPTLSFLGFRLVGFQSSQADRLFVVVVFVVVVIITSTISMHRLLDAIDASRADLVDLVRLIPARFRFSGRIVAEVQRWMDGYGATKSNREGCASPIRYRESVLRCGSIVFIVFDSCPDGASRRHRPFVARTLVAQR